MAKIFAILCIFIGVGVAAYLHLRREIPGGEGAPASGQELPADKPAGAVKQGGKSGFIGNTGYLLDFPSTHDAAASMQKNTEVVFFFRKGAQPTADESKYKELGMVRLEVMSAPVHQGKPVGMEDMKKIVLSTLEGKKETATAKDISLSLSAFMIDITAPKPIKQLFVRGTKVIYVFTGADTELMLSLAGSITENDSQ